MRRLVSLLIVVVLAFTLVGCGGGGDAAATEDAPAPAETAAPAAVEGATIGDRSVNVTTTFEPFPTGTFVPTDLKNAIDAKQPTLIFFYDSSHTSSTNRDIIDDGPRGQSRLRRSVHVRHRAVRHHLAAGRRHGRPRARATTRRVAGGPACAVSSASPPRRSS